MPKTSLPLALCANGCGVPPCPPSLVICRKCMDRIGEQLERGAAGLPLKESAHAKD
jgi:hypothetical protein